MSKAIINTSNLQNERSSQPGFQVGGPPLIQCSAVTSRVQLVSTSHGQMVLGKQAGISCMRAVDIIWTTQASLVILYNQQPLIVVYIHVTTTILPPKFKIFLFLKEQILMQNQISKIFWQNIAIYRFRLGIQFFNMNQQHKIKPYMYFPWLKRTKTKITKDPDQPWAEKIKQPRHISVQQSVNIASRRSAAVLLGKPGCPPFNLEQKAIHIT